MRWEIPIDGWRPHALNELMKAYHMRAAQMKRLDRDHVIVFASMLAKRIPPPTSKRRISLRITLPPRQRRWDIDAFQKSTLDACKHATLIRDDNENWAEWGGVTYVRNPAADTCSTVVIVEEPDGRTP